MVAAELFICLTLQAEGCTLELWNAHKGCLKKHFGRIVDEVRAQQREDHENGDQSGQQRPEEPPPAAVVHSSCKGDSEGSNSSRQGRSISSSTSRVSPTSTLTNARQPALKPITALIASIKSELGLPPASRAFLKSSTYQQEAELTRVRGGKQRRWRTGVGLVPTLVGGPTRQQRGGSVTFEPGS